MQDRRYHLKQLLAAPWVLGAMPVAANDDRSTMSVLVGAASSMDFTARVVADYLRQSLERPVVAVSKLGAGGRVALGELKRSAPDGRTIMLSTSSAFVVYPAIYAKLEYDPVNDFTPIINVAWFDVGIAVAPALGVRTLTELVSWAKSQKGPVVYGCAPGTGSASHFAGIATEVATGLKLKPITYKDSAQGIADAIGGRIPIMITGTSPLAAQHKAGKLLLLATSGPARSPLVPDVPTMKEGGVDASVVINASLYGPAGMNADQVQRIHDAAAKMLADPLIRTRLEQAGMAPAPMDAKALAGLLASERQRYAELARVSGMKPIQN